MNTTKEKFRIGIVGLQPGRSWSAVAHLAAIRQLSDTFDIAGVANSTPESSRAAAKACGIPRAFTDVAEMASSPGIDIIVVTVRVPGHLNVVRAALNAGKHVYCEWPLGRNLDEAKEMAELARKKKRTGSLRHSGKSESCYSPSGATDAGWFCRQTSFFQCLRMGTNMGRSH